MPSARRFALCARGAEPSGHGRLSAASAGVCGHLSQFNCSRRRRPVPTARRTAAAASRRRSRWTQSRAETTGSAPIGRRTSSRIATRRPGPTSRALHGGNAEASAARVISRQAQADRQRHRSPAARRGLARSADSGGWRHRRVPPRLPVDGVLPLGGVAAPEPFACGPHNAAAPPAVATRRQAEAKRKSASPRNPSGSQSRAQGPATGPMTTIIRRAQRASDSDDAPRRRADLAAGSPPDRRALD